MDGRSRLQPPPGFDQSGRRCCDRFGARKQIGLVRLEESKDRGEQVRVADPVAQISGLETGQSQ
jgi:hypothetical protein